VDNEGPRSFPQNPRLMPETPDRPHRTGLLALDFVIAACAIVISFASLWVALRSESTQHQLLQASVWPYVQYDTSDATENGGRRLSFELRNEGVGPAIVRSFALAYNGHYYGTLSELMAACCGMPKGRYGVLASTVQQRVIMAHELVPFIETQPHWVNAHTYALIGKARARVTVRLCYCSVLGDCWFVDTAREDQPSAVNKCPPAQQPQYTT